MSDLFECKTVSNLNVARPVIFTEPPGVPPLASWRRLYSVIWARPVQLASTIRMMACSATAAPATIFASGVSRAWTQATTLAWAAG